MPKPGGNVPKTGGNVPADNVPTPVPLSRFRRQMSNADASTDLMSLDALTTQQSIEIFVIFGDLGSTFS